MSSSIDRIAVTYIGGPTVRLDVAGLRLLTDPTFDAGGVYEGATSTLTKLRGPALDAESVGPVDAVLLSHDHHFDNLDHAGRVLLASARTVLTTPLGASRLGPPAIGLEPSSRSTSRTARTFPRIATRFSARSTRPVSPNGCVGPCEAQRSR